MKNYYLSALLFVLSLFGNLLYAQSTLDQAYLDGLVDQVTPLEVVVAFQGAGAPSAAQVRLLNDLGITQGVTMHSLPIAGVLATPAQISALLQQPDVASVALNEPVTFFNDDDTKLTGVDRLRGDKDLTAQNGGLPVSGKGVGVVINDSGVDGAHGDHQLGKNLVQNVLATTNLNSYSSILPITYLEDQLNTDTNSGHGTHVAGTVGGNGSMSGGKYEGVAPGARLVGYGSGGVVFILDAVGGLDYALTHQFEYNIRVTNNSWGTSGAFNPSHPVNIATKRLYDRGIVSVFAAGNSGPGDDTHNPYAVAPWVISVAAGDKFGRLASFSSRGVKDQKIAFTIDGESWVAENRPTLTAPGVNVVSTKVVSTLNALSAPKDSELELAHQPYYTHKSGTSMASPHTAGVVALLLEANPSLSPAQVMEILQLTATNMPGRESWEVGAGYINAYAAVDYAFNQRNFGTALNYTRSFNSSVNTVSRVEHFTIDFNPAPELSSTNNEYHLDVPEGTISIEAKVIAGGISGETGNPVNLSLISPDGKEYRSGIFLLFTLYQDRAVAVASPMAGRWTVRISGLRDVAFPENLEGKVSLIRPSGTSGMEDIVGHPAEASIIMAVSNRLTDGRKDGFKPDEPLKKIELADYLMMGQGVRQYFPTNGSISFSDLSGDQLLLGEAAAAKGAALRDRAHQGRGVILAAGGKFMPNAKVKRAELAYSMVQSLGLEKEALELLGTQVTVLYKGERIALDDAAEIPAGLEGYVQIALDLKLINAFYSLTQDPYSLEPVISASFKPLYEISRAEFAVIITRTFEHWEEASGYNAEEASARSADTANANGKTAAIRTLSSYPNPFQQATNIAYTVEEDGMVEVAVYTLRGERVSTLVKEVHTAGQHTASFQANGLQPGLYICRIAAGDTIKSIKLLLQ